MAQILFNGFGLKGTLGIWAIIVLGTVRRPSRLSHCHIDFTFGQIHDGVQYCKLILGNEEYFSNIHSLASSSQQTDIRVFSRDRGTSILVMDILH